jgi:hypothetical protein
MGMDDAAANTALEQLDAGDVTLEGLVTWGSNYTFLAQVCHDSAEIQAIYKPRRGERPLWDFPAGTLCQRERAAYLLSETLGWRLVPPTVLRKGPHGYGSLQLFIDHDPEIHYFSMEGDADLAPQLQRIVLFDAIANNADRKAGHVIMESAESSAPAKLWGIDHGICFHDEYKLRSVIWEFAGATIPADQIDALTGLLDVFGDADHPNRAALLALLSRRELDAMQRRTEQLVASRAYPTPGPGRHYPWPMV